MTLGSMLPLSTPRLLLRALRASDVAVIHGYRNDPVVARYQDWTLPFTLEAARRLVSEQADVDRPVSGDWIQMGVEHAGELIGDLAVGLDRAGTSATIGYTLRADHWRQGYATESVGALVDALFERRIVRVAATLDPLNIPSARLLERLGFGYEGRAPGAAFVRGAWVDDDRYALGVEARGSGSRDPGPLPEWCASWRSPTPIVPLWLPSPRSHRSGGSSRPWPTRSQMPRTPRSTRVRPWCPGCVPSRPTTRSPGS